MRLGTNSLLLHFWRLYTALASHEPQFALLREEVVFGRPTTVDAGGKVCPASIWHGHRGCLPI